MRHGRLLRHCKWIDYLRNTLLILVSIGSAPEAAAVARETELHVGFGHDLTRILLSLSTDCTAYTVSQFQAPKLGCRSIGKPEAG